MKIGFIGLGNMGAPMAINLAKAGHELIGYDAKLDVPKELTQGVSSKTLAKDADVVILMLPNGEISKSVAFDILPVMQKGSVMIDCSTIDVASAKKINQIADENLIDFLDAPVSGGVVGACSGSLTFMVGGKEDIYTKVAHLFNIMGQKSVFCGAAGNGQSAKICNNMILGVTMIATCEAFSLADNLGLDRQAMYDVVSASSGSSWSMNTYCPAKGIGPQSPSDNDYLPGFASDLMLKDLRLAQQAANEVQANTPMGKAAVDIYETFVEKDNGSGLDFSAILPWIKNINGS